MRHMPQMLVVMTPFPHHIDASASLAAALQMMEEHAIRHLPVFEDGDIIGIISERDLQRAHMPGHPLRAETELLVGDLCTNQPYFVDISDPLDRVLDAMADKRIGSALVLKEGDLVGVFTAVDAYRLLANTLREHFPQPGPGTEAA
jgi:acetoin utilization protein AcuB